MRIQKQSEMIKSLVQKYFGFLMFLVFVLVPGTDVEATHIVGGDMTYRCLGGQVYEITLTLRRDCLLGSSEAQFDDPAVVRIFDQNGRPMDVLGQNGLILFAYNRDDTLNEILKTECEVIGGDVCVHTTTYRDTVTLPFRQGGYQLAYQRCCRNKSLTNVENADSVGMTIYMRITELGLQYCNSSPVFDEWPSIYVCGDRPILTNHGAFDREGDSIVYKLCTPYEGASILNPKPSRPKIPPYDEIIYRPPYSLFNLMGGTPPLSINAQTGVISGFAEPIVGQYLIGVCMEEYRNGRLLSIIRRDFQYNVRICTTNPVAGFESDDVRCDGDFKINFQNNSINYRQLTWYFDYPNLNPHSTDTVNVMHTYTRPGAYKVALVAVRDADCIDTLVKSIYLYDSTQLKADFLFHVDTCRDTVAISFIDRSFDSLLMITDWHWQIILNGDTIRTVDRSPMINFTDTGLHMLGLL